MPVNKFADMGAASGQRALCFPVSPSHDKDTLHLKKIDEKERLVREL